MKVSKEMGKLKNRLKVLIAEYEVDKGKQLTQAELAVKTGIARETISRMVSGEIGVSGATIEKLCNFFKCQPGELLFMDYSDKDKVAS